MSKQVGIGERDIWKLSESVLQVPLKGEEKIHQYRHSLESGYSVATQFCVISTPSPSLDLFDFRLMRAPEGH